MFAVPAPAYLKPRWYRALEKRATKKRTLRKGPAQTRTPAPAAPKVDRAWAPVRNALRADIASLEPAHAVDLRADEERYVLVYHYGDRLSVDCAGSQACGGAVRLTPAQEEQLIALAFTTPMDRRHEIEANDCYRRYLPTDRPYADEAAGLAAAALAILGVQPTDHLAQVVS